ncbi:MAG: hypothetical protein GY842_11230 [bacterium]|nr:hypothetical protein [bacterium]
MAPQRSDNSVRVLRGRGPQQGAFTLLELLVVVGLIVVLITILLPSLHRSIQQAAATVCMNNVKQIGVGLEFYRMDNGGWAPITTGTDDERSSEPPLSVWFQKLVPTYLSESAVLVCPDDPLKPWMLRNGRLDPHAAVVTSSYGMNDVIHSSRGQFLCNLDRARPKRPANTLLIADRGPDVFYSGGSGSQALGSPNRGDGSLPWDDGYLPGDPGEQSSWITARHLGGMNALMYDSSVRRVATRAQMRKPPVSYYPKCAAGSCALCAGEKPTVHYSFVASQAFWWTGPVPTPWF